MRAPLLIACLTTLVLTLPGCLKSEEAVTLKADGSGTIEGTYVADLAKLRALLETARMFYADMLEAESGEGGCCS